MPDMAGAARGKVVPAAKFGKGEMKMPEGIFAQTISGDYVNDPDNVEDRDMLLVPDPETLRPVPWAADPAASVFLDCYHRDGSPVEKSPRAVLRNVLTQYEAKGWIPVVAPEVEFYLLSPHSDPNEDAEPPEGRLGWTEGANQPYSIDTMNDFDPFINESTSTAKRSESTSTRCHRKWARRSSSSISCMATRSNSPTRCSCSSARFAKQRSSTRCTRPFWPSRWQRRPAAHCTFTRASSIHDGRNIFSDDEGEPSDVVLRVYRWPAEIHERCDAACSPRT